VKESLSGEKLKEIQIRLVSENDAETLLNWRNLPEVRKWSRNSQDIDLTTHQEWLKKRLSDEVSNNLFFIIENDKVSVGMVRFDEIRYKEFEINILVDPNYQKLGIAELAINLAVEHLLEIVGSAKIYAAIHSDNIASLNLFSKLNFETTSSDGSFQQLFRSYELKNSQ
jgi:RimJ/RimL family protein N-acetyltransferase